MPTISLTEFFEFISATGLKKTKVVKKIKNKGDYDPQKDFYKGFRDAVKKFHVSGLEKNRFFKDFLDNEVSSNKYELYKQLASGYKKFLGKKDVILLPATRYKWDYKDLTVRLSPVWIYKYGNDRVFIKPHLDKASLSRAGDRVALLLCLMNNAFPSLPSRSRVAVLDVARSKVYDNVPQDSSTRILLEAEAETFLSLYTIIE